ncbi:unnamed protein product [Parajaminaea phylloscopi]
MACQHLTEAFANLNPPRPSQQVHRDECTLCFDDQDGPNGIDVCLLCFNGGCTGNGDREHARLHFLKTGHALVANVKRRRKPRAVKPAAEDKPVKLAIAAESEEDLYEWSTTPKCLACNPEQGGKALPRTDRLEAVIEAVMKSLSSSQRSEAKAWEEEIVACEHTRTLKQPGEPYQLEASGLAKCGKCDLTSNLWLCLTCGNLGCGRAQFGGVGGNSHGLTHFEESGHPVSVKQGTITAEGTADIYCYACNDARLDPDLARHLRHFGMNVMDLSKTEKSMTELQLEQNLKFDFVMTGEDGKELEPLFGPNLTGLKNLGNSCYLASTMQALFSFPAFQARYRDAYRPHTASCTNTLPATCLECQLGKLADGLSSGRYSVPRPADEAPPGEAVSTSDVVMEDATSAAAVPVNGSASSGPVFQAGIRPAMFKELIGKGHEEFATMRQQDADEFLKHVVSAIQKENRRVATTAEQGTEGAPTHDPTSIFGFTLQQRLQCLECKRVRYTQEVQDAGLSLPVPLRPIAVQQEDGSVAQVKGKDAVEGVNAQSEAVSVAQETTAAKKTAGTSASDRVKYESVSLRECLDIFTAPETLEGYHCPACEKPVTATKQTLFTTFPDLLAVQARRFQLINWVPQKVDVPILVPLEPFALDKYLGTGKREDEEELPEAAATGSSAASGLPQFDAGAMSQLTAMGFPEIRCQKALLATGNTGDAEAAMNWLFAHMEDPDIDDPIDLTSVSSQATDGGSAAGATAPAVDTSALEDMGFSRPQARKALRVNGGNAEMAVAWLFENADDPGEDEAPAPGPVAAQDEQGTSGSGGVGGAASVSVSVSAGNSDLPAQYRLKSFVSHKGPSVHSGHYVAHIRMSDSVVTGASASSGHVAATAKGTQGEENAEGDQWVFFNDEKVVKAPLTSVRANSSDSDGDGGGDDVGVKGLSRLAYVYFFERI